MKQIDITIIIVSWKVKDLLDKCLASIKTARGNYQLEIFVVDNGSADGTVEMIREKYPEVKLLASQENLGFAKANNLALSQAKGEFVLLLNPDTEITADNLEQSVKFISSHPKCGAMGPKMRYCDGRLQPSVRRLPTLWPIILMLLKIPKLLPRLKAIEKYLAKDFDYDKAQAVEQIMGAYMFLPQAVISEVGNLDERFFIWFEEVDYCRRLKDAGYEIWYNPAVAIVHHGGKSFAQQAMIANQRIFFLSAMKYFLKYAGKN